MSNKHDIPAHICPYCLKRFETANAVKTHQSRKKHRVSDRHEGARMEKDFKRYDAEKRRGAL